MSLTRDLTALVDDSEPYPASEPALLGRYHIESEIGHGAMGVVYRAMDPVLGRRVALKVIRLPFALGEEDRILAEQRFLREASLAASISHPNSVVVHDFGRDEETDLPFIAFEYLEGRSLTQVIADGPRLAWREALRITARLADALHHAHQAGVIHRDVKPGNVMLLASGEPKILDFGIARVSTAELTGMGDTWGTPAYMSPEQVTGGLLDARSDLFSLGSLCFELLTGRPAFRGDNVPQIVARIAFGDTPRPSGVEPTLSRDVDLVLARALAKDPAQRYADGRAFAEDIDDVLEGRPLRERDGLASPAAESGDWSALHPLSHLAAVVARQTRPRRLRWVASLAGASVAALGLLLFLPQVTGTATQSDPLSRAATSARSGAAVVSDSPAGAGAALAASQVQIVPAVATTPSAPPPARLALSVEHRLESGRLRVFVDDALALDRRLTGRSTRHLLILKRQTGSMGDVVEVSPGQRSLRFEVVDADGTRRTGRLRGSFRSDETRLLRLRAGKRLDLEWQS
jgi:hypothetical protein